MYLKNSLIYLYKIFVVKICDIFVLNISMINMRYICTKYSFNFIYLYIICIAQIYALIQYLYKI